MRVPSRTTARRCARGAAMLLWTIFIVFATFGSAAAISLLSKTTHDVAQLDLRKSQARGLSYAATEHAVDELVRALLNGAEPPAAGAVTIDGDTATYTIVRATPAAVETAPSGIYEIVSAFQVEGVGAVDNSIERTRRLIRGSVLPVFQFAMFWENDMVLFNPAQWTIRGRVHCNSKIYVQAWTQLTFDTNYLRAVDGIYGDMPHPYVLPNTAVPPLIRKWVVDPFNPGEPVEYEPLDTKVDYDGLGIASTGGLDSNFGGHDADMNGDFLGPADIMPFAPEVLERWGPPNLYPGGTDYTVQTSDHGIGKATLPEQQELAMYQPVSGGNYIWNAATQRYVAVGVGGGTHDKGPYHEAAGLSVLSYPDGTWRAFDAAGLEITTSMTSVISSDTIYDARQAEGSGNSLQTTRIDMDALNSSGHFPANGLLYVAGYGAGSGTAVKGFELTNASELYDDLTVVSPDSVYLRGDYNTSSKKAAAVIADAVNLLSNAWDNSKTPGALPLASETTYNTSFITGDVADTAAVFSGGPHNVLRRHEDWSGVRENILGSIVCPFRSQNATGDFALNGDYYKPPDRVWTFDTDLNQMSNLPPFTPGAVDIQEIAYW